MIEGTVNAAREAVVRLTLQGPTGQEREVEAVIDTGYSGFLTTSPALVSELGLAYRGQNYVALADGSEVVFDFHALTVLWDGQPRHVDTDALGDAGPLVGMALLDSHSLYAEVEDGGRVVIGPR